MPSKHLNLLIGSALVVAALPVVAQQQAQYGDPYYATQPAAPSQSYPTERYPAQQPQPYQGSAQWQGAPYSQQQAYPQAQPPAQSNPFRRAPAETYDYAKYSTFQELGRRNMAEGNLGQAEDRFAEALQINPFDPVSLNNLAVAKAEQGQYHTARELLERAGRLDEGNQTIAANLARLRGWLNTYAGNELAPRSRVTVPASRQVGSLPPPPPALWDPTAERQRIVIPSNERYERTYTPSAAYQTYTQPSAEFQTYPLPDQRFSSGGQ